MKRLRKIVILLLISSCVYADHQPRIILDKVSFQVSAKQWVSTHTALLDVNINSTLTNADLVRARAEIILNLNKITAGDWHLLEFNRAQDTSGLEKLFVHAQVRVDQQALTDIYQHAKEVSKPGAQYTVSSIEFKPSLEEVQSARVAIRQQLYQQVNEEIARMNKAYPEQHYSVNNLTFVEDNNTPIAPMAMQAKAFNALAMSSAVASAPLSVSNELVIMAVVEAASNRRAQ